MALDDEIVSQLSNFPEHIYKSVISTSGLDPWSFPTVRRCNTSSSSSLEALDLIPLELLHTVLTHLDILSLSRFSCTSRRAIDVVKSLLPLKRFLAATANAHVLTALAHTKTLGLHCIGALYAALASDRCASCGAHGAFLHLLLAQRCCYLCLVVNQSLWMVSLPRAKECFSLSDRKIKNLPTMQSLPGIYTVFNIKKTRQRTIRMTSVRAAKELALRKYGSMRTLDEKHPVDSWHTGASKLAIYHWYRKAPLQRLLPDPLMEWDAMTDGRPDDSCAGMGIILFPSLLDGHVEPGHWCAGCESLFDDCDPENDSLWNLPRKIPPGYDTEDYIWRVRYRSYSTSELVQHAKTFHSLL